MSKDKVPLNVEDELLDEDDFVEIEDAHQYAKVQQEGKIYESIEDELEVYDLEEFEDIISDELEDSLGG